jgi:hypothetical protein
MERLLTLIPLHLLCICGWANGIGIQFKKFVLIGASALCCALWRSKNDMVFVKALMKTYMQVLY